MGAAMGGRRTFAVQDLKERVTERIWELESGGMWTSLTDEMALRQCWGKTRGWGREVLKQEIGEEALDVCCWVGRRAAWQEALMEIRSKAGR